MQELGSKDLRNVLRLACKLLPVKCLMNASASAREGIATDTDKTPGASLEATS